jgi:hypothetical protein
MATENRKGGHLESAPGSSHPRHRVLMTSPTDIPDRHRSGVAGRRGEATVDDERTYCLIVHSG